MEMNRAKERKNCRASRCERLVQIGHRLLEGTIQKSIAGHVGVRSVFVLLVRIAPKIRKSKKKILFFVHKSCHVPSVRGISMFQLISPHQSP
jgi:hypothetical protein